MPKQPTETGTYRKRALGGGNLALDPSKVFVVTEADGSRTLRILGGDYANGKPIDDAVSLSGGQGTVNVSWAGRMGSFDNISRVRFDGRAGNDILRTSSDFDIAIEAFGGEGDDSLQGGKANDLLHNEDGNDTLRGGTGDDYLWGDEDDPAQAGNDVLDGGAGEDHLYGFRGRDTLKGGADRDYLYGGDCVEPGIVKNSQDNYKIVGYLPNEIGVIRNEKGEFLGVLPDDYIDGGSGEDKLHGGSGHDTVVGGADNDQLCGDDGTDRLEGGAGQDQLEGGAGDDVLEGGDNIDHWFGQAGDDALDGGDGADSLSGGEKRWPRSAAMTRFRWPS